jgi:hypothetical protein
VALREHVRALLDDSMAEADSFVSPSGARQGRTSSANGVSTDGWNVNVSNKNEILGRHSRYRGTDQEAITHDRLSFPPRENRRASRW